MQNIVFIEPNKLDSIPFTTSKVIAEYAGMEHRKLKATIHKHKHSVELFGLLALYGQKVPRADHKRYIN